MAESLTYTRTAKLFHWGMALLVIGMLIVGLYMTGLEFSPEKLELYANHKSVGIIILALAVLRLIWRWTHPAPPFPEMPRWQVFAARASHCMLYALLFMMPLLGWAMSSAAGFPVSVFGLFTLPNLLQADREAFALFKELHELSAYLFIAIISLHIAAALYHHCIRRDDTLRRMVKSAALAAMFVSPAASAETVPEYQLLPEKSTITLTGTLNNADLSMKFTTFDADIRFSPEQLDQSYVALTIQTDSITGNYPEAESSVISKGWLNVTEYPTARVVTEAIRQVDGNQYEADASLTLKETTRPVKLRFMLDKAEDHTASVAGFATVNRLEYDIGWDDVSVVKDPVRIDFTLFAKPE